MLLQHPESLAKTAYSGLSAEERRGTATTAPHLSNGSMVEEYSKELTADVQIIKMAASSYNQDAAAAVSRYQAEYEMHLTVWLNALGKCTETANAGAPADASPDMLLRNRKAENKFKRFREWRDKAMKGVQRKFLPRTSPVTELDSAKANLKEREDRQRLMKRANSILRSKKDVATRLIELLGPGSEEEIARIQQPDQEGCVGYSAHELNNNNANIFRLKRRVKDLEKKIGLMDRSSEEMKETNGIKMIYNYAADRIQLFFTEKPVAGKLRQLKGYGWHWSPSAGCWQRKITESAKKSAEMIYKGEAVEERNVAAVTDKAEKEKGKQDKKKEAPVSAGLFAGMRMKSDRKVEEVISPVKGEMRTVVNAEPGKEEVKPAPVKEPRTGVKKATRAELAKELKIAAKRELKREIIVKARPEMKAEVKPAEKPKVIDWSKIAAQVASRQEPKTETIADVKETGETQDETAKQGYSYEAYSD